MFNYIFFPSSIHVLIILFIFMLILFMITHNPIRQTAMPHILRQWKSVINLHYWCTFFEIRPLRTNNEYNWSSVEHIKIGAIKEKWCYKGCIRFFIYMSMFKNTIWTINAFNIAYCNVIIFNISKIKWSIKLSSKIVLSDIF